MLGDPVLAAQVRDLLTEPTRSGDREDPEREDEPRGQPGRRRPEARHRAQVSRQAADECLVDRWNARRINRPGTRALGSGATDLSPIAPLPSIRLYRSSLSSPAEAGTAGLTGTSTPDSTHALWLGAKRGASNPSLISRVTAKRLSHLGGRKRRRHASDGFPDNSRLFIPATRCRHCWCRPAPLLRRGEVLRVTIGCEDVPGHVVRGATWSIPQDGDRPMSPRVGIGA